MLLASEIQDFQEQVWQYYTDHARHDLPWRQPESNDGFDPYKILVSELMLQQTQVSRVIPKFTEFLVRFPTVEALSQATLGEVLIAWQGLGYNRRAKYLWQTAATISAEYQGTFPATVKELMTLPGVGTNTAGAIMAYAYNKPVAFVETNIRTVFIHHFCKDQEKVSDKDIVDLVLQTVPPTAQRGRGAREWYWALMDYGTYIKQEYGNKARASRVYVKQSTFQGSRRQIRGMVIRELTKSDTTAAELSETVQDERLDTIIKELLNEGLIQEHKGYYSLA